MGNTPDQRKQWTFWKITLTHKLQYKQSRKLDLYFLFWSQVKLISCWDKRCVGSHACSKMLRTVTFHCVEAWFYKVLAYIMPYHYALPYLFCFNFFFASFQVGKSCTLSFVIWYKLFVGFSKFPLQAVPNLIAQSLPEGVKLCVFVTLAWMSVLLTTFTRFLTQFFLPNKSKFDKESTDAKARNLRNSRWSQWAVMRFKTGVYA